MSMAGSPTIVTNSKISFVKNVLDQLAFHPKGRFAGNTQFKNLRSIEPLGAQQGNVVHKFNATSVNKTVNEKLEMKLANNSIFIVMGISLGFQVKDSSIIYYNEDLPGATDAEKESLLKIQTGLFNLKAGTEKEVYRRFELRQTREDASTKPSDNEYARQIVWNPYYWAVSGENELTGTIIPTATAATPTAAAAEVYSVLDIWGIEIEDKAKALYFSKAMRLPELVMTVLEAWENEG